MILTLQEDGVLRVYDSPDEVARDVEPLDAEDVLRAVFDDTARPYTIEWIRPNRHGRSLFGLLRWSENGEYHLVPMSVPDPAGLLTAIHRAVAIEPPAAADAVHQLERRLRSGHCEPGQSAH